MSTRANVIIRDKHTKLYFYRHSDGYPEVTGEELKKFVKGYATHLRSNVGQSAGWLIVQGHEEYADSRKEYEFNRWKVGSFEPTDSVHGDIEFLYVVDLEKSELRSYKANYDEGEEAILERKPLSIHKFKAGDKY